MHWKGSSPTVVQARYKISNSSCPWNICNRVFLTGLIFTALASSSLPVHEILFERVWLYPNDWRSSSLSTCLGLLVMLENICFNWYKKNICFQQSNRYVPDFSRSEYKQPLFRAKARDTEISHLQFPDLKERNALSAMEERRGRVEDSEFHSRVKGHGIRLLEHY